MKLPNFDVSMVKWCGMHVLNLGVDLWVVGGVLKKLLSHLPDLWGDGSDDCRLYIAWQEFKQWCRLHHYQFPDLGYSLILHLACQYAYIYILYIYINIIYIESCIHIYLNICIYPFPIPCGIQWFHCTPA